MTQETIVFTTKNVFASNLSAANVYNDRRQRRPLTTTTKTALTTQTWAYRWAAVCAVAYASICLLAVCIAIPVMYTHIQRHRREIRHEISFCTRSAHDVWLEVNLMEENGRLLHSAHNRTPRAEHAATKHRAHDNEKGKRLLDFQAVFKNVALVLDRSKPLRSPTATSSIVAGALKDVGRQASTTVVSTTTSTTPTSTTTTQQTKTTTKPTKTTIKQTKTTTTTTLSTKDVAAKSHVASGRSIADQNPSTIKACSFCCSPGQPGPPGPQGVPGAVGEPGSVGQPGVIGRPATNAPCYPSFTPPCPQCYAGLPGEQGSRGPIGDAGPQGPPGYVDQKPPGYPGPPGQPGPKGYVGPPGFPGRNGVPGPVLGFQSGRKGRRGSSGPPGYPGYPGSPSEHAPQGPPGAPGMRGQSGHPGFNGHPGYPGQPGFPGRQGSPGICPRYCAIDGGAFFPENGDERLQLPALSAAIDGFKAARINEHQNLATTNFAYTTPVEVYTTPVEVSVPTSATPSLSSTSADEPTEENSHSESASSTTPTLAPVPPLPPTTPMPPPSQQLEPFMLRLVQVRALPPTSTATTPETTAPNATTRDDSVTPTSASTPPASLSSRSPSKPIAILPSSLFAPIAIEPVQLGLSEFVGVAETPSSTDVVVGEGDDAAEMVAIATTEFVDLDLDAPLPLPAASSIDLQKLPLRKKHV